MKGSEEEGEVGAVRRSRGLLSPGGKRAAAAERGGPVLALSRSRGRPDPGKILGRGRPGASGSRLGSPLPGGFHGRAPRFPARTVWGSSERAGAGAAFAGGLGAGPGQEGGGRENLPVDHERASQSGTASCQK